MFPVPPARHIRPNYSPLSTPSELLTVCAECPWTRGRASGGAVGGRQHTVRPAYEHRERQWASRLPRTRGESVGQRSRDSAGSLPTLGIRSQKCLPACWHGCGSIGTDFRASRNGGGSEPAAAHSRIEYGRAMARRRGLFTDFRDSVVDRPDVSRSECMSANAHFSIFVKPFMRTQAVRDSPRKTVSIDGFGGLPANFEYVPHPALHAPRLCTSTSCNESPTLA